MVLVSSFSRSTAGTGVGSAGAGSELEESELAAVSLIIACDSITGLSSFEGGSGSSSKFDCWQWGHTQERDLQEV